MTGDQVEEAVKTLSLGDTLKSAREDRAYSRAYVVSETLLQEDIIIALEEENYSQLPAAVFVRGYIRTYAKLLEIDVNSLLDAYNQTESSQSTSMLSRRLEQRAQYKQPSNKVPIVSTMLVVLVLFALSSSWWLQREIDHPVELLSEDIPGVENLTGDEANNDYQVGLGEISPDNESSLTPNQDSFVDQAEVEEPEGIIERVLSIAESNDEQEPVVSGDVQDPVKITVTFLEESWTEIFDVRKRRLLHGLIKQGAVRVVYGEAPFNIFFGNAQGVEVMINDKPFNHIRYARENKTARFLVEDGNS